MGSRDTRNEFGYKNKVQIEIRGEGILKREFRNRGEAINYLRNHRGMSKDEINKRVRFIGG
jgi:hypothetical protein